jgi:hypothetical protein
LHALVVTVAAVLLTLIVRKVRGGIWRRLRFGLAPVR